MQRAKIFSLITLLIMLVLTVAFFLFDNYFKSYQPPNFPSTEKELIANYKDIYTPSYILSEKMITGSDFAFVKENLDPYYEKSTLIIKCKKSKDFVQLFNCTEQTVNVLEVYKGNESLVGQDITFTMSLCFSHQAKYLPYSFVNFMNDKDEYLLFLYPFGYAESISSGLENGNNYTTTDLGYMPYFNLSKCDNVIAKEGELPVYKEVINNEFFVDSQYALDWALQYKEKTIKLYTN